MMTDVILSIFFTALHHFAICFQCSQLNVLQFVCTVGHACAVSTRFDQVCKKILLFDTFCSVLFGLTFAGGPSKAPGRAMSAEGVRPGVASFVARGRP